MKKVLCVILAMMLIAGVSGCGKKNTSADGEVPTLTWYVPGDAQSDLDSVMEEVNKITVPEIGAKLKIIFIDQGAFSERMKMMMASQEEMDLVFTGFVNRYHDACKMGGLLDITDMLKEVTPELYSKLIPEYAWQAARYKNDIYAVPNMQIMGQIAGFAIDKDLADKYGFDYSKVKEAKDLEPFLQKVKDNEPDRIPSRGYLSQLSAYYENNYARIVRMDKKTGKMIVEDECPGVLEDYIRQHEWWEKGYVRKDIDVMSDDTTDYLSGKYAVINTTNKPGNDAELKSATGVNYVTVPWTDYYISTASATATMTAVSATSKHPELALKMIELVNKNKDLYNLIVYGIEGKHYTVDENDRVHYIEEGGYVPKNPWKFGNTFNAYLIPGQDSDVWEQTIKANDDAIKSEVLGIAYVEDAVKQEITQCANIKSQYTIKYSENDVKGAYERRIKELKEAGADRVREEYQRQHDEYLKNNK